MTLALILATMLNTTTIQEEQHCAAQIIYHEARGEQMYQGKTLPAVIAGNRVLHDEFPDTICSVMLDPGQFDFVNNGLHLTAPENLSAWRNSQKLAEEILNREIVNDAIGLQGAVFFQHVTVPNWNPNRLERVGTIGNHKYFTLN